MVYMSFLCFFAITTIFALWQSKNVFIPAESKVGVRK